jgi:tetratricopeptide (TPR) repeat protein
VSEDKKTIVKMAHIYTQEGRWDKAVNEYKKLLKLDPEDFNTYSVLGDAYVKKGELQPAFDAYLVCSDAYVRLGQLEKAALAQSKIARLDPEQLRPADRAKQAVFKKQVEGDKAMEAGELDKAIEAYQDVLKLDRDRFDLYQKLGDLYLRKGETEAACAKYLEIGNIYFTNKLYKKAAPIFLKVVELDPEQVDAHSALAEIQAKSGNESEAKKEFITLTEFLFQRGDYDRAYQFAQRAEALKAIESYNYIGHVLLRRGKLDEAKGWFEKLLKFKLNHAGALWGMGLWHFEKGQYDEAQKNMSKVPATERFYAETQVSLGAVYEKMGKPDEAMQAYQIGAAQLRKKGLTEQAQAAEAKIESLGGVVGATVAHAAPAPSAELSQVEAPQAAPAPATAPAAAPAPVEAVAAPAPPPLPVVAASAPAALPPLPVGAAPEAPAHSPVDPDEEIATLVSLAESQEDEGDFDGALSLYQSIIDQFPADPRGKQGLARVYSKVGKGAVASTPGATAAPADDELNKLATLKAEAEAEQAKAQAGAAKQAEERAKAEAAAKAEAEERAKKEMEALRLANEKSSAEAAAKAVAEAEARFRAETEKRMRAEIEARQAAEAEAKRQAEVAAQQVDEMRKRMEAEIRQQLEAQMRKEMEEQMRRAAEEGVRKKVEEARQAAEAEAKKSAEAEIRRQFEEESKKLANQEADAKKRMEDELRQRLTAEIQQKKDAEAREKVQAVRTREEEESRKKIQSDVLARVQAQQKEKMAPLQRTIDEIRRKVEEQQAANAAAHAPAAPPTSVGAGSPRPAPTPVVVPTKPAAKPADDELDDMDPFMNAAVADIYVKQGLVQEAIRIYEKILKLDPNNAEIQGKLDAALGRPAAAPKPSAPAPAAVEAEGGAQSPKKSKVSYL